MSLHEGIEKLSEKAAGGYTESDRALFFEFKGALNRGEVRKFVVHVRPDQSCEQRRVRQETVVPVRRRQFDVAGIDAREPRPLREGLRVACRKQPVR